MRQYCRYCVHLTVDDGIWCDAKKRYYAESYAKHTNTCKLFQRNEQDAFGETDGYKERRGRRKRSASVKAALGKASPIEAPLVKAPFVDETCPICGKVFIPAPQHIYRTEKNGRKVCSWSCQLESERRNGERRAKG